MKNYIYKICLFLILIFLLISCEQSHNHSTSEYFIDPTCTEVGYHVIETCCSETKQIVIPALGHTYIEGICERCGEIDPNYMESHIHKYVDGKCACGEKELINIYINNGKYSYTISVYYGDIISIDDYDFLNIEDEAFDNWYLDNIVYDFNNVVTESFSLNAKYFNIYTVTFIDSDGSVLDTQNVIEGHSAKPIVTPEKQYYEFIGWDKSLDNISSDTVITAIYNLTQTVFNIDYVVDDSLLYYSSKSDLVNEFLNDFYEFVKPNISYRSFVYGIEGSDPLWTYFIGGSFGGVNYLIYNNSIEENNDEYFFNSSKYKDKWYKLSSYVRNNICKSNKRFGYEEVEYNYGALDFYRYMTDNPDKYLSSYGGEDLFYGYPKNDVNLVNQYEYNKNDINLYIPTDKSFGGWYKDEKFTDGPYNVIEKDTIGDVKLYAKIITNNIYTINFETLSSDELKPLYASKGSEVSLPIPIKDGCDFLGWYIDYEKVENEFIFNYECDITLTAKWDDPNTIDYNYIVYEGKTITYRNSYVAVEIPEAYVEKENELRACWVSSFIKNFEPSSDKEKMIKELTYVLDFLESYNMNCMIFHVRTHNNAFYNTDLAPIPSEYGTKESFEEWDYLEWLIDECHKRGIEFHAWLNPYRIKLYGVKYTDTADVVSKEYENFPLNPASVPDNILLTYYTTASGGAILNPAKKEVQDHIVDVCLELASKYNIDAIHFDDYFYQKLSNNSSILEEADQLDYIEYINNNPGTYDVNSITDKEDWRRMNVSELIRKIHLGLSEFNLNNNRNVRFGISPTGTYKSGDGSIESGSNTGGGGHYNRHLYADTVKWVNEEWIDYIMPQCYTSFNYNNYSFHEITTWWNKVLEGKKCDLYIGLGLHNSISSDYTYSWKTEPDELINQLLFLNTLENVKGVSMFSFSSMKTVYNNEDFISHNSFMKLKNELWLHKVKIPFYE